MIVLAEYSSSYSVYLSYDVGSIYFDLAQAHKHFQTIVQLMLAPQWFGDTAEFEQGENRCC